MMVNNDEEIEDELGRANSFAAGKLFMINLSLFEICAK
jgi:hypothetical protein